MRIGSLNSLARERGTHWGAVLSYISCVGLVAMAISAPPAQAYRTYSEEDPSWRGEQVGNCKTCHGNFPAADYRTPFRRLQRPWREGPYTHTGGPHAGETEWLTSAHDVHRHIMLEDVPDRCFVCHMGEENEDGELERITRPVYISESAGDEAGLSPTGCMGCHGREGDNSTGELGGRMGAGLRQHHTNAGVTECMACHPDADPANYTPLGEDVEPPNYMVLGIDPCNRRQEDFAGSFLGLDNDGDLKPDWFDRDCR